MSNAAASFVQLVKIEADRCIKGSDGRILWTVSSKVKILEAIKSLKITQYAATVALRDAGMGPGWHSKLERWSSQSKAGRFNIENAVAVRKHIPAIAAADGRLDQAVFALLEEGRTQEQILTLVGEAMLKHGKVKIAKELKDYMEARGITIDDLKQVL